ncbi:hypothetical protein ZOSMA_18G01250 [Zostera marina]|uniref:O-fucosyltransferase family protein n=1 Tax=Zostera marina TaxID=29655 RepID=A0A0K9PPX7_ZOSMR|nr:hypothetical protein ZOSMA_18G01250 [Zostera marina]
MKTCKTQRKPISLILVLPLFLSLFVGVAFWAISSYSFDLLLPFQFKHTSIPTGVLGGEIPDWSEKKYLYWGNGIDCPGNHRDSCQDLFYQELSFRCALEEAMYLKRIFVMPSRMYINSIYHNKKAILHTSAHADFNESWAESSCAMNSLYDLELISRTVPVVLDDSKMWDQILLKSVELGKRGMASVEGISRYDLKDKTIYSDTFLINRTANYLSWFIECKDHNNGMSTSLPYSFLPLMAARKLRIVADKIKEQLGVYDAIHVYHGNKMETRNHDHNNGVAQTLHLHINMDTRLEFIQRRIKKWTSSGRILFIASNVKTPRFFSPLASRYKLAYSSNYSNLIDPIIENNYQLIMIERLVLIGAKHLIKATMEDNFSLTNELINKKNIKNRQIPIYS